MAKRKKSRIGRQLNTYQFRGGHKSWNGGTKAGDQEKSTARLVKRPTSDEIPQGDRFSTMYVLRPEKDKTDMSNTSTTTTPSPTTCTAAAQVDENIICGMENITSLVHTVQEHMCPSPLSTDITSRKGLCIYITLSCTKCNFRKTTTLSRDICEPIPGKRGPPAAELNERFALACMKTKGGPSDFAFFLSTMNIKPPSSSAIYQKFNHQLDKVIALNIDAMINIQNIACAKNPSGTTDVETDVSYNNRLQAGFEAGTQAFAPMIDQESKLILGCQTANKL